MRRRIFHSLGVVLISAFVLPLAVAGPDRIVWFDNHFPPMTILHDPFSGKGSMDLLQAKLKAALPEFSHEHKSAEMSDMLEAANEDTPLCSLSLLHTPERAQFVHYSHRLFNITPPGSGHSKGRFGRL